MIYTLKWVPRAVGWRPEVWYVCNSDAAARRARDMTPFVYLRLGLNAHFSSCRMRTSTAAHRSNRLNDDSNTSLDRFHGS